MFQIEDEYKDKDFVCSVCGNKYVFYATMLSCLELHKKYPSPYLDKPRNKDTI